VFSVTHGSRFGAAQATVRGRSGRVRQSRGRYIAFVIEDASNSTPSRAIPARSLPAVYTDLEAALRELAEFSYGPSAPLTTSRVPGGRFVHQIIDRAVSRQVDAVRAQSQFHADAVHRTLAVLTEIVVQQLDDLQDGLAELQRAVTELQAARDVP
jgi:hypothetical protein